MFRGEKTDPGHLLCPVKVLEGSKLKDLRLALTVSENFKSPQDSEATYFHRT